MKTEWDVEERSNDGAYIFRVKMDKQPKSFEINGEYNNPYFEHAYLDGSVIIVERGRLIGRNINVNRLAAFMQYEYTSSHDKNANVGKLTAEDIERRVMVIEVYELDGTLKHCRINDDYLKRTRYKESVHTQNLMEPRTPQDYLKSAYRVFQMKNASPIDFLLSELHELKRMQNAPRSYDFISQ